MEAVCVCNTDSAVFKAPQHSQLRVVRKHCKGPQVDTKILKKILMNFELSNHVSD